MQSTQKNERNPKIRSTITKKHQKTPTNTKQLKKTPKPTNKIKTVKQNKNKTKQKHKKNAPRRGADAPIFFPSTGGSGEGGAEPSRWVP